VLNSGVLYAANALIRLLGAVTAALVVRAVSVSSFGVYTLALTITLLVGLVQDFGTSNVIVRRINQDARRGAESIETTIALKLLLTAVTLLPVLAVVAALGQQTLLAVLAVMTPVHLCTAYSTTLTSAYNGAERFDVPVRLSVLPMLATPVLTFALLGVGAGVYGAAAALVVGSALTSAVLWRRFTRDYFRPHVVYDRRILLLAAESLPFFLLALSNVLYTKIDTFVLAKVQGVDAVAVYGAAVRFLEFVQIVPNVLTAALLPISVRLMSASERRLGDTIGRVVRLGLFLAIPVVIAVVWAAPTLTTWVFGERYDVAARPLQIMAVAMVFSMVNSPLTLLFYAGSQTRRLLVVPVVLLVVNIAMNIYAVTVYSYNGAAVVTLITEALGTVALVVLIVRTRFDIDLRGVLRGSAALWVLTAVLLAEVIWVDDRLLRALLLLVTYVGAASMLRYPRRELANLGRMVRSGRR
jgi:O-antigen/teichoic acid export membrane protein